MAKKSAKKAKSAARSKKLARARPTKKDQNLGWTKMSFDQRTQ
jgi:hypothetical protein